MKIAMTRAGDEMNIALRGDVNEASEEHFKSLLSKIEVSSVMFDVEKIELVNSLGARYWINFINALQKRNINLGFMKCSVAFVECCNIYPKFVPSGTLRSLMIMGECKSCGLQESVLLDASEFASDDPFVNKVCSKCKKPLASHVDLDEYLQSVRG
jgi:anti-anti-sigma regulatory factor